MSNGQVTVSDMLLDWGLEIEESHRVCDGRAGFSDSLSDQVLFESEVLGESDVASRFFDRIKVLSLKVLDESHLQDLLVGGRALDDWDFGEAKHLRSSPSAFARNELHFSVNFADDEWLDDAELGNGLFEFVQ